MQEDDNGRTIQQVYAEINLDNIIKNMSEKKQVITMQILIVFFIVVSVLLALDPPTFIAQLMGIPWGALAGAFLAPFLYGLYWKGVTKLRCGQAFFLELELQYLICSFNISHHQSMREQLLWQQVLSSSRLSVS